MIFFKTKQKHKIIVVTFDLNDFASICCCHFVGLIESQTNENKKNKMNNQTCSVCCAVSTFAVTVSPGVQSNIVIFTPFRFAFFFLLKNSFFGFQISRFMDLCWIVILFVC